jgi:hypothetical protein
MGFFFEMMIAYHAQMKNTYNLKIVVFEILKISKYDFKNFKLPKSFARCKWVIMCMIQKIKV